jgi:N-acylglucosamine 2-epimerase
MNKSDLAKLRLKYKDNLLQSVVPFWEKYSPDTEAGGYFTCLDRDGTVFDTDKFIWMQGREVWTFSRLYGWASGESPERQNHWLELAAHGARFLREHGQAPNGDWYFSLDRLGRPLVEPYNIFSDYFAAAGLAEYHRASGEPWALELALSTFNRIQGRKERPKGSWTKQISTNRPLLAMGIPMMDAWMARELRGLVEQGTLDALAAAAETQVMKLHVDRGKKAVFERVSPDGGHPDCMDGRLLNPGHALEVLWFLLRQAAERGDKTRIDELAGVMLWCASSGWDVRHGGFFYYRDYKGYPTEKLESGMKLWWVHVEALCAFLLAFKLTGNPEHLAWFERIDAYTFDHFPDREYGEWYGYLDRQGDVALSVKGGKWKGFFHIPRALMQCVDWLHEMEEADVR